MSEMEPDSKKSQLKKQIDLIGRLSFEHLLAGLAATMLIISIFLSWYKDPTIRNGGKQVVVEHSAFANFSLVELALLLLAGLVITIVIARAEITKLRFPLSDGLLFAIIGVWAAILVVYRMIARPEITVQGFTVDFGLQWGVLLALTSATAIATAGFRLRRKSRDKEAQVSSL